MLNRFKKCSSTIYKKERIAILRATNRITSWYLSIHFNICLNHVDMSQEVKGSRGNCGYQMKALTNMHIFISCAAVSTSQNIRMQKESRFLKLLYKRYLAMIAQATYDTAKCVGYARKSLHIFLNEEPYLKSLLHVILPVCLTRSKEHFGGRFWYHKKAPLSWFRCLYNVTDSIWAKMSLYFYIKQNWMLMCSWFRSQESPPLVGDLNFASGKHFRRSYKSALFLRSMTTMRH